MAAGIIGAPEKYAIENSIQEQCDSNEQEYVAGEAGSMAGMRERECPAERREEKAVPDILAALPYALQAIPFPQVDTGRRERRSPQLVIRRRPDWNRLALLDREAGSLVPELLPAVLGIVRPDDCDDGNSEDEDDGDATDQGCVAAEHLLDCCKGQRERGDGMRWDERKVMHML